MGIRNYRLVVLWYLLPLLYLFFIEGIFLGYALLIAVVFIAGLSVGYFSFNNVSVKKPFLYNPAYQKFFLAVFWLTIIVQVYGFYRVIADGFDLMRYRMDFYETTGGIFQSTYLYTLYTVFLTPLFLIGTMYFLAGDLKNRQTKKIVLLSFLFIILDGVLRLGRFQYLFILFFLYLSYRQFGLKRTFFYIMAGLGVVVSFAIIYFRQFFVDSAVDSALDIVNADVFRNSVTSYQYNGYIYLDTVVKDKSLLGHPWEMNTASFLFLFIKTFTIKFGLDFNYSWEGYNLLLTKGMYLQQLDLEFNAFSTNFFPIYLDAGIIGIFLYGLISGGFLGFRTNNRLIKTVQYLNLFILIFGLYQPVITTLPGFVLIIAFLIGILYIIRVIRKTGFSGLVRVNTLLLRKG